MVAVLGGGCSSATEEIATAINGSLPLVSANIVFIIANEVHASLQYAHAASQKFNIANHSDTVNSSLPGPFFLPSRSPG